MERSVVERRYPDPSSACLTRFRLEEEREKAYQLKQQVTSYKWELVEAVRRAEMAEREMRTQAENAANGSC